MSEVVLFQDNNKTEILVIKYTVTETVSSLSYTEIGTKNFFSLKG